MLDQLGAEHLQLLCADCRWTAGVGTRVERSRLSLPDKTAPDRFLTDTEGPWCAARRRSRLAYLKPTPHLFRETL
jgi:hypothetical protein